ncbi:unnamed protein product [Symbiodinium sp. CCMP2456]|nr:unnamed protein product [Symbiodinium sp. CCMP2456]
MSPLCSRNFFRLGTQAESHWGVAIWIHKRLGILRVNNKPVLVDEPDVHIVVQDKRLLIVRVATAMRSVVMFSGHCPHAARDQERKEFLATFAARMKPLASATLVIGGWPGRAEGAGGLWILVALHRGPSATFQHPQGPLHRIDFIVFGGLARIHQMCSRVAEDFDTANLNSDHWAVEAIVNGQIGSGFCDSRLHRPRYDRAKMLTVEGQAAVRTAMACYQPPAWDVHVDEHCRHFQDYVVGIMNDHFRMDPGGPRAGYIPEAVWKLREHKIVLKKKAKHRRLFWKQAVGVCFQHWSRGATDDTMWELHKEAVLYQLVATAVGYVTDQIKKGIATGKNALLRGVAGQGQATTTQILRKARACGIGGRQAKPLARELPLLLDKEGQPAQGRAARDLIWLQHFSEQEHGRVFPVAE